MRISDWSSDVCSSDLFLFDIAVGMLVMIKLCRRAGDQGERSTEFMRNIREELNFGVIHLLVLFMFQLFNKNSFFEFRSLFKNNEDQVPDCASDADIEKTGDIVFQERGKNLKIEG